MRVLLALFAALAFLGCPSPPELVRLDAARPDTPPIDAFVPLPDVGPPVCAGTVTACSARTVAACEAGPGCRLDRCVGTADDCRLRVDPTDCAYVRGCYWAGDDCEGEPEPCSVYGTASTCRIAGCSPDDTPSCAGFAPSCESLDLASCEATPGCDPVGIDAGTELDAGPPDAGPTDAGRTCGRSGTCHPLYDASCRCGYSATAFDWACGRSGTGVVGGVCTTSANCGAGLWCSRRTNAASGTCRRLCDEDTDCGASEACAQIDDISVSCSGYCLPLSECSIVDQDCGSGRGCYWLVDGAREHNFCARAGTAEANDSCYSDPTACMAGYVCASRLGMMYARCHETCTTSSSCPGSETCDNMTAAGEGYCL